MGRMIRLGKDGHELDAYSPKGKAKGGLVVVQRFSRHESCQARRDNSLPSYKVVAPAIFGHSINVTLAYSEIEKGAVPRLAAEHWP
jgi:hypothetical protein